MLHPLNIFVHPQISGAIITNPFAHLGYQESVCNHMVSLYTPNCSYLPNNHTTHTHGWSLRGLLEFTMLIDGVLGGSSGGASSGDPGKSSSYSFVSGRIHNIMFNVS